MSERGKRGSSEGTSNKTRGGNTIGKPHIELVSVDLTVNGRPRAIRVEPRMTLLDALREDLALTGTKKACDRGECGACTVHVDGRRVLSCMTLAAMLQGKRVTTIEGLEQGAISTPSRRRSSRMMGSSAASARRGR